MFDRFTDRARKVMGLARQEAQRFNHDYIGTEHILLGLVQEGSGVAASVLKNLDVDLKKVRQEVERLVSTSTTMVTVGQLPFTPRARKVLELSLEEASGLGHTYIGTEHLLLGLLRESEGIAAQVLRNLKVKVEDVREEVLELLGADPADTEPARRVRRASTPPTRAGFEWLGRPARSVMGLAAEEARGLNHDYIGTGHILLGLFREGSRAALALKNLGVDPKRVREEVERLVPSGATKTPVGQLPFSSHARSVLERSIEEATSLVHAHVGTEHLLLGLVRESEGTAAQVLRNLEVRVEDVRDEVLEILGEDPEEGEEEASARSGEETVLERQWTEEARRAFGAARDEAARLGHDVVEPDHLLVALLAESPRLADALRPFGIDLSRHLREVEHRLLDASRPPRTTPPPVFSRRTRGVLRRAARDARHFGAVRNDVEHLLWALVRDDVDAQDRFGEGWEGVGRAAVLALCGLDPKTSEREIERVSAERGARARSRLGADAGGSPPLLGALAAEAFGHAIGLARRFGGRVAPDHVFFGVVHVARTHPEFGARTRAVVDLATFVADEVVTLAEHGEPSTEVVLAPATLAVLSIALASAAARGAEVVEADDLLLALLSSDEGAATSLLRDAGVDPAAVVEALRTSRRPPPEPSAEEPPTPGS